MPDSIIVYRNPIEKAFWEGGYAIPMMCFALAMGISFIVTFKILEKVFGRQRNWMVWVSGIVGVVSGYFAFVSVH